MANSVTTISSEDLERRIIRADKADLRKLPRKFDMVLIGEYHPNPFVREHLMKNARWIDELGINAYGAEAPIEFQNHFERVYNSYRTGGEVYVAPEYVLFGPTPSPRKDKSYRDLAYLFAKKGIHIFPFDPREFNNPNNHNNRNGNIIAKDEKRMASIIEENMRKYGKTLILAGELHPRRWKKKATLVNYLEETGYKCVTLIYNGGDTTGTRRVEIAARKANREDDEFILKNSLKSIPPRSDYIVHLPQKIEDDKEELILRHSV